MNHELSDVQARYRKGRGTRDQNANILWIIKKERGLQKNIFSFIYFSFIGYAKVFDCVDHNKLWKILKEMGIPDHLTFLLRNPYAGQEETELDMEQQTGSNLEKEYVKAVYCHPVYLTYMQSTSWNAGLDEAKAGIKIAWRNINNLRLMAESEELKSLLMKLKEESGKVGLKLNIQKTKIMASGPITSWQIDEETMETVRDFIFGGSKITVVGDWSHEIKRGFLLGRKVMTNLDSILKSRDVTMLTKVHLVKAMVFPVVM